MSKASSNVLNKKVVAEEDHQDKRVERNSTEAYQVLQLTLKFIGLIGIGLGYEMRYEWECNRRFVFTKAITAFIWSLMFYTQYLYICQHEVLRTTEVFAIYGIAGSAAMKLYCFETHVKNITALMQSTLEICQQCTGIQAEKLTKRLEANFTYVKSLMFIGIPVTIIYVYYPVKSYIIDGELVPFVPLEIMFIDQSTLSGYCIASCLMVFVGILAVLGTLYMGLVFVAIILSYGPRVDIFEANFNELDGLWSCTSTSSVEYRHMFLRNICRKYVDMRDYNAEVKEIFDRYLFVLFTFIYLSQILCLYQIRANNWIPGYALAIGFFLEMIFHCIMGTKLTEENDRIFYILSQSNWYTYDMRSQKLFLILLSLATNSDELWIGPLKPLNVLTASEIIKSIYSYYTVMMEVM